MDKVAETVLCVIAAAALVGVIVWVTRLKIRGAAKFLINSIAGGALIAGLSAFKIIILPFNLFTALTVGILGVPGAAVVVVASMFL